MRPSTTGSTTLQRSLRRPESASSRGNGQHDEMDRRAIACFDQALEDVGFTAEPLRRVLHDYFAWATTTTMLRYHASKEEVPEGMNIQKWSWDGLER